MSVKKSIQAPDNAPSKDRKKTKFISPGKALHRQLSPEMTFHGHNLRSRQQFLLDARQILRKDQTIVLKDPKDKRQQEDTSLKDQKIIRKYAEEKYKKAGTSRKDRAILQKGPREKCEK